ncbi:MAG: WXG100 family type VII secretion target [Culicoidibacterales bacterium]
MNGSVIRLDQEALTNSSSGLKAQAGELESLISQASNLVRSLPEHWHGAAADAFVTQFDKVEKDLGDAKELLITIASQIDQTLNAVQELDSQIAGQLR